MKECISFFLGGNAATAGNIWAETIIQWTFIGSFLTRVHVERVDKRSIHLQWTFIQAFILPCHPPTDATFQSNIPNDQINQLLILNLNNYNP